MGRKRGKTMVTSWVAGGWGSGESINLVFQSQATETDSNSTCWPIVDMLRLKTIGQISESRGKTYSLLISHILKISYS